MVGIPILNKRVVGNRGEYVGRPSALGNPFKLEHESERDVVIQQYELWLQNASKLEICGCVTNSIGCTKLLEIKVCSS